MSLKKVSPDQPEKFEFNDNFKKIAEEILKKYPEKNKKKCCYAISLFGSKTKF